MEYHILFGKKINFNLSRITLSFFLSSNKDKTGSIGLLWSKYSDVPKIDTFFKNSEFRVASAVFLAGILPVRLLT